MKYRIRWYAKKTGATGYGQPVFSTLEMARQTANQLNDEWPLMSHSVEMVDDDATPSSDGRAGGDGDEVQP